MTNDPPGTTHRNQGCDYREQLGPQADGRRLVDYLSQRYQHSSPDEWADHIAGGLVLLDGSAVQADQLLKAGQELVWQRPAWDEPAAPRWFDLLYADDDLLAVAKPAGLPTLPGANFLESTLLYLVQQQYPDATPLHRLGRWTSGLVLCAKSHDARRELLRQWSARQVGKRYRALASGSPAWDRMTIETPIGPVDHPLLGTLHAATPHGKTARSAVTVLERRDGSSLCDVAIDTGRPHQIRIHLASAGHPLLGDPLYQAGGRPTPDSTALPGDPGYQLHSAELHFCHPRSGQPMVITCRPPAHLRTALEAAYGDGLPAGQLRAKQNSRQVSSSPATGSMKAARNPSRQ